MASFSAADVKRLRDMTGAGMMDAKNALVETDGDFETAIEVLRVKYAAKVDQKAAERTAGNGLVAAAEGALVEVKCETDFVAKNETLQQLAADLAAHVASSKVGDREALLSEKLADGRTVEENIASVAALVGEKLELGRVAYFDGQVASYMHKRSSDLPPQIGVLVEFAGADLAAARGAAQQVAAMRPVYLTREEVPADVVENERRISEAKARESGKPEQALPKIVDGMLSGFFKETVLLEQAAVQDSKKSVKQLLDEAGVSVSRFARFEVGSG